MQFGQDWSQQLLIDAENMFINGNHSNGVILVLNSWVDACIKLSQQFGFNVSVFISNFPIEILFE